MTDRQSQVLNELQNMMDCTVVYETQKEVLQQAINDLAGLYVHYPNGLFVRECKECRHYVVKDSRSNWNGEEPTMIYGCEFWECEFSEKEATV